MRRLFSPIVRFWASFRVAGQKISKEFEDRRYVEEVVLAATAAGQLHDRYQSMRESPFFTL